MYAIACDEHGKRFEFIISTWTNKFVILLAFNFNPIEIQVCKMQNYDFKIGFMIML